MKLRFFYSFFMVLFGMLLSYRKTFALESDYSIPVFELKLTDHPVQITQELFTKVKGQWYWRQAEEGVKVLKIKTLIEPPKDLEIDTISTKTASANVILKDNKIILTTAAIITELNIKLKNKTEFNLEAKLETKSWPFINKECLKNGIRVTYNIKFPFFFAALCTIKENKVQLQISLPEEVDIEQSTIFDTKGKGEVWKIYDLGEVKASQGLIGKMTFKFKNQAFPLELFAYQEVKEVKTPDKKEEKKEKKTILGLGLSSLKINSAEVKVDVNEPSVIFKLVPIKLFWNIGFGFDFYTSIVTSSSDQSTTFLKISPYTYLKLLNTKSLFADLTFHFSLMSQNHTFSQFGYQVNQFGSGIKLGFPIFGSWLGILEYVNESIESSIIQSSYFYEINFIKINPDNKLNWGFGVHGQATKLLDVVGNLNEFNENSVYLLGLF